MSNNIVKHLLEKNQKGQLKNKDIKKIINTFAFEDLGHSKVDHNRSIRKNFPEVILFYESVIGGIERCHFDPI